MTILSQSEIEDLDRRIDARIDTFPLLRRDRDTALFSILITFDDWIDRLGQEQNLANRRNAYHSAYDSLDFCIQWINQRCPRNVATGGISTSEEILIEALSLFTEGMNYAKVWTQMSLLRRGRTKAELVSETRYLFSPVSHSDRNRDTGRMLIPGGSDPEIASEAETLTLPTRQRVWENIRDLKARRELGYSIPGRDLDGLARGIERRSLLEWHMDPSWDLGGYTFGELRKFWASLQAIQAVHSIAVQGATELDKGKNSEAVRLSWRLMKSSHQEWVNRLSRRSGLNRSKTELIILDLTYDESMYGPGKSDPHVLFTPFFNFDNGLVGLSPKIVQISNIERNIWTNIHRRRQPIIDKLKYEKEGFWIQQIAERLKVAGFVCVPRIGFTFEDIPRNLDLLILSPAERFGLICELKWITGSDDVKAVVSMDSEIAKGVQQAKISEEWLRSNLSVISDKSGLGDDDLKSYSFKPLVLTKEGLPSGFVVKPDVPVVSENLFNWILLEPHQFGLERLWELANSLEYLPKEGVHFRNISPTIKWGNLSFELENLAFEGLERWRPEREIN